MVKVKDVIDVMRKLAPEEYYYNKEYDNIGLIVGDAEAEVTRVLCCLDVTEDIIDEAVEIGAQLIISHHPMIYFPIKNVTTSDSQGRKIFKAIRSGVSIYAAHTNLDFVRDGINQFFADKLGLTDCSPLDSYISEREGFGRVGNLPCITTCSALREEVKSLLGDEFVRIVGVDKQVKRIAVINGGGGGDTSYIDMALKAKADCLVTADVKHHVAIYARENDLPIIEPQHFTMEYAYISRLVGLLGIQAQKNKIKIDIVQSKRETNPRF